ncbi:MAG TPA: hypothetical protein VFU82_04480 [Gammaproteobacteria bacterium]|nr:hypothetical protein [Gammaproteobacteria bacterium]
MRPFTLNFTYGDIRAILNQEYHEQKGLWRKLRSSDQSGIQTLESTIAGQDDATPVSPETFLIFVGRTTDIIQTSLNNPKNSKKKEAGTFKKKAHLRCSEALLDFFLEKLKAHYLENNCASLKNAIMEDDQEYIQWYGEIQDQLSWYENYKKNPKNPKRVGLRTGEDNPLRAALLAKEENQALIGHLKNHPNNKIYETLLGIPDAIDLVKHIINRNHYKGTIDNIISKDNDSIIPTLDILFNFNDSLNWVNTTTKKEIYKCAFIHSLLRGKNQVLHWLITKHRHDHENLKITVCEAIELAENAGLHSLGKFLPASHLLTNQYNFDDKYPDKSIEKLLILAFKQKSTVFIEQLWMAQKYTAHKIAFEKILLSAFINATKDDPSILDMKNENGSSNWLNVTGLANNPSTLFSELINPALDAQNSALIIFLFNSNAQLNPLNRYMDILSKSTTPSEGDFVASQCIKIFNLAESNNPSWFTLNPPPFDLIRLFNLALRTHPTENTIKQQLTETLCTIMAKYPEAVKDSISLPPVINGNSKINTGLVTAIIKTHPLNDDLMIDKKLAHPLFAIADLEGEDLLNKRYPNFLNAFIEHESYHCFKAARENEDTAQLSWLIKQLTPENIDKALECQGNHILPPPSTVDDYKALIDQYPGGALAFIRKYGELIPPFMIGEWLYNTITPTEELLQANVKFSKNLFHNFVILSNLEALKRIAGCSSADALSRYIRHNGFINLSHARNSENQDTMQWLLEDPDCLAHAESATRHHNYSQAVEVHLNTHVTQLQERHAKHETDQLEGPFDVANEREAKHAFYMIRALIRHGDTGRIRYLLSLPSVRALAHQAIGREPQENELLQLAMRHRNDEVCELLLDIPEVRRIAEENNFYSNINMPNHGIDLRQLAENRESSMVKLNENERHALDKAFKYYNTFLGDGIPYLIDSLREAIIKEYEKEPATIITSTGKTLKLPVTYHDFERLPINEEDRQKALAAYYQHDAHGALRFLSRPNPWIHPNASFVEINPHNPRERHASDRCDSLIAVLYLAAIDEETPCIREFTPRTKWLHFLRELALINRGHNWDKIKDGKEYDDMEADRPSCGSGMERRLFQAVPGNPLLDILTEDTLRQVIGSFAFNYFTEKLSTEDPSVILQVLEEVIMDEQTDNITALKPFNIPKERCDELKSELVRRYEKDFTYALKKVFDDQLELDMASSKVCDHYHMITLLKLVNIYEHLERLIKNPPQPKPSEQGLFAKKDAPEPEEPTSSQTPRKGN